MMSQGWVVGVGKDGDGAGVLGVVFEGVVESFAKQK